ncbi:MAG: hypothetical protein A3K83_01820, partial [Omnitrophica WOR_2 bacterium RBG_13_44_8b]
KSGAKFLHVVDLDGAMSGKPKNLALVKEIAKNVDVPVEFGGGVRSIDTIKELLSSGIKRVVLGTKAAQDSTFLKKAYQKFKDKIIVSVDAKDNRVLIKGWKTSAGAGNLKTFVQSLKKIGFGQLIYTDTLKDGTLTGPNVKGIKSLLKESQLNVIASGGISSLEDIYKLKQLKNLGLIGIIVGKALYEGKFTLSQALKIC